MTQPAAAEVDRDLPGLELVPLGPPFVVDSVALEQRGSAPPDFRHCELALGRVKKIYGAVRYWLGDLMNLTETLFAEEASQLIDAEFLSEQEVKDFCFVSKNVKPTTRAHAQSWEHAKVVARLKEDDQVEWLDKSREGDWSSRKLATEIGVAAAKGKTTVKFWLIVECGTEARQEKLAEKLTAEGYGVKKQDKVVKVAKAKKPKKEKRGPVTAQKKRRGAPKMNTRKRLPR